MDPERPTSKPVSPSQPIDALNHGASVLREHIALCREYLTLVERENHALGGSDTFDAGAFNQGRSSLMPRLDQSSDRLQKFRVAWQALTEDQRKQQPEVANLVRQAQDVAMKILVLDRENEQHLLRRGLLTPHQLPAAQRQRPRFIADLYKRGGAQG